MFHLLGFILLATLIKTAFEILGVESKFYFDEVALLVVMGGTFIAAMITYPFKDFMLLFSSLPKVFKTEDESLAPSAKHIIQASQRLQKSQAGLREMTKDKSISPFLRDGLDLLISGLNQEELHDILTERIYRDRQRDEKRIALLRNMAKYPPAFGLIGTVLGLVSLMRTVGSGADSGAIGLKMALALVATLYGLVLANFILVPLAEHFSVKAEKLKTLKELELEGLLLLFEKRSPLAVQEMMNSYLDEKEKLDLIGLKERAA